MQEPHTLKVEGMTCANCARSVSNAIQNNGGKNISVDFISGEASFDGEVDLEIVSGAIESVGYKVESNKSENRTKQKNPFSKSLVITSIVSFPLLMAMFFNIPAIIQLILAAIVVGIGTKHFGKKGLGSIKMKAANMDVLVLLGAYFSFGYSFYNWITGTNIFYFETSAIIITLVILGKWMEKRALTSAQSAIESLKKLLPNKTFKINNLEKLDGEEVLAENLKKGDLFLAREGEKIPADAKVFKNEGFVNEALITGESKPIKKQKGDLLLAGAIVESGNLIGITTAVGGATYLSKVIELVKKAQREKPQIQLLADKISAVFVPIVIALAILTFLGWFLISSNVEQSIINAIAVLVISCPCAMGLATPTAVSIALGTASKNGIYIKNANAFETFQNIKIALFDKTGTITEGNFKVQKLEPKKGTEPQELYNIIYGLEQISLHPIAKALISYVKDKKKLKPFIETKEIKGFGVLGKDMDGNSYRIGKIIENTEAIQIEKNGKITGEVYIADEVRKNTSETLAWLSKQKIEIAMVSGDSAPNCQNIANQLNIKKVYANQKPDEKLKVVEQFQTTGPTLFIGDGINDAPVLTKASIGISPTLSTDVAINSADVVLNEQDLFKNLKNSFILSKKAFKVIKQNLFWAFFYNTLAIPLAIFGFLNPMIAAGAMSLSSLFVVSNSLRLRKAL